MTFRLSPLAATLALLVVLGSCSWVVAGDNHDDDDDDDHHHTTVLHR